MFLAYILREIDIPPLWLTLFAAVAWGLGQLVPLGLPFGPWLGLGLIALALVLMSVAAAQMVARHTTFVPRRDPNTLVTTGVFALSRNPIYLADAILLSGLVLYWDALLAAPLVPLFMAFITVRYIRAEERVIGAHFGPAYAAYCEKVRRWL